MFESLIKISRPRFWLYLAGPFLVGAAIAGGLDALLTLQFFIGFLFFLIPANVYLYGINDLFDEDTDQHNIKKRTKEHLLKEKQKNVLTITLGIILLVSIIYLFFVPRVLFAIFLFLATFYSVPPLRFKARPILDFSSNILYALPGIIAYVLFSGAYVPIAIWIALFAWTGAMHWFSAIPDIVPDRKAGVNTSATLFGKHNSLILTSVLWMVFATIIISSGFAFPYSVIVLVYPIIPLLAYTLAWNIEKVYWYYPWINALMGFGAFLGAILL